MNPLAIVSVVAAIATVAGKVSISGVGTLASVFTLWVLLPALVTLAIGLRTQHQSAGWVTLMALPLAFGVTVYVAGALGPSDAQIGLLFVFVPLWQFVGLAIVAAGIAVFRYVRRPR